MNQKRMIKTVIMPDELKDERFSLTMNENRYICYDCHSILFYIKKLFGVVYEELEYGIMHHVDKTQYRLREYGFKVYCAECGHFQEIEFIDTKDSLVCDFDDLDGAERGEIEYCLGQYNQRKTYTPLFKTSSTTLLREKIKEFESTKKIITFVATKKKNSSKTKRRGKNGRN